MTTEKPATAAEPSLVTVNPPAHPTKVRIDTPGVSIEVEAHEPLDVVAATAMRLFQEAGGWPQEPLRTSGFVQAERRDSPPAQASGMPHGPGPYPVQFP